MIALDDVGVCLGGQWVLENANFEVPGGGLIGLIGPNGAGKTTLVRTINGLCTPDRGEVRIDGDRVRELSAREVSRRVATVPQDTALSFAFPVREIVAMGRAPHRSRFERESPADREAIEEALERVQIAALADRSIEAVSGGERQRVLLARALCQRSAHLLLDEPTASLDIGHGVRILRLARELASEGKGALAAIHDLDLAARFCERLVLLSAGEVLAVGAPEDVLTESNLEEAFDVEVAVAPHPVTGARSVVALPDRPSREESVHVLGGGQAGAKAISECVRAGFRVTAGVLPVGDVALARTRALGVEASTTEPFAPVSPAARRESTRMVRAADVTVLAADRELHRKLAAESERTVALREREATGGKATAVRTADGPAGGEATFDTQTPVENETNGDEQFRVAGEGTLLEAIERMLCETGEDEN